ncbi:MAG: DUF3253 domain-containing protein [Dokdonella sp.]
MSSKTPEETEQIARPASSRLCASEMTTAKVGDDHYFVVAGRRWRRTDPHLPASLRTQLTKELMSARRAVKFALAAADDEQLKHARARVDDAKVALGERGPKWWLPYDKGGLEKRLKGATRALLRQRDVDKSICPSEVARIVAGDEWREQMPRMLEIAWQLESEGWLQVTRKGVPVSHPTRGPIRLRRTEAEQL